MTLVPKGHIHGLFLDTKLEEIFFNPVTISINSSGVPLNTEEITSCLSMPQISHSNVQVQKSMLMLSQRGGQLCS